jgi:hypothetical protein
MERLTLATICAFALAACGQAESSGDAGSDGAVDVHHAPDAQKCTQPEADGTPTYHWSFDQQTLLEDNRLIVLPPTSNTANGFDFDNALGCGECFEETQTELLGDLDTPGPQVWRLSVWFRGNSDGTLFELEGLRLTIQSGMLAVACRGATPPTYATSLNVGDGVWHGVALHVDATSALAIQVFADGAQDTLPASLPWAADLTSVSLLIGGNVDPTAAENDLDELSFFFH